MHAHVFVQTGGLRETFAAHGALEDKKGTEITFKTQDAVLTWQTSFTKTLVHPGHSSKRVLLSPSLLCVKATNISVMAGKNNL